VNITLSAPIPARLFMFLSHRHLIFQISYLSCSPDQISLFYRQLIPPHASASTHCYLHLIFFHACLIHIFHRIFSFFFLSFPFSFALHMDSSHISDIHIHLSIHPAQFILIASLWFISLYVVLFSSGFFSCFFIVYFLCFVSSLHLRFLPFLPLHLPYHLPHQSSRVSCLTHGSHTNAELEREGGVESRGLDVPASTRDFSLPPALSPSF